MVGGWSRRPRWAGELAAVALLAVALFPRAVLLGEAFFERDVHLDWYAQASATRRLIAAGGLPLWNPWVAFGQPMLANANQQLAYPPTWLLAVVSVPSYYTLYVFAHFVLLGMGALALARRLGAQGPVPLAVAAITMLSGPLLSLVNLWHHLGGAAWLPWTLLAADRALDQPGLGRALAFGAAIAMQVLVGSPETAIVAMGMGAVLTADWLWRGRDRAVARLQVAAGGLAFGIALSAIQWMPALAAAGEAQRAALPPAARLMWSLHPLGALEAIWPLMLDRLPLRGDVRAALYAGREAFLRSIYLGITTIPLVAVALLGPPRRLRAALAVITLVAVILALGAYTPLFPLLARLPVLSMLRYPVKFVVGAALGWSLLAGLGLETWRSERDTRRTPWPAIAVIAAGLTVLTASAAAWVSLQPDRAGPLIVDANPALISSLKVAGFDVEPVSAAPSYREMLTPLARRLALAAGLLAVLTGFAVGRRARTEDPLGCAAVAALCVADLFCAHVGLHRLASSALLTTEPPLVSALRVDDRSRVWAHDYATGWSPAWGPAPHDRPLPPTWPSSVAHAAVVRSYAHPAVTSAWGLEGSFESDRLLLFPAHVRRLIQAFGAAEGGPDMLRLLQVAAVSRAAALHTAGMESLVPFRSVACLVDRPALVFVVPGARPRTYVVGAGRIVTDDEVVRGLVDPAFDPARMVLLAGGVGQEEPPGFQGSAHIVGFRGDRVDIDGELSAPGYLVLVDAYDRGWKAEVDGTPVPILRANGAFRAVALGPGRHRVTMRYRPAAVLAGAVVSAAALAFGLAVAARSARFPDRLAV